MINPLKLIKKAFKRYDYNYCYNIVREDTQALIDILHYDEKGIPRVGDTREYEGKKYKVERIDLPRSSKPGFHQFRFVAVSALEKNLGEK